MSSLPLLPLRPAALALIVCVLPGVACAKQDSKSSAPNPPAAATAASPAAKSAPANATAPASDDARCTPETAFLPAGSFKLGATGKLVKVDAFCIDTTEVTARQYAFCVDVGRCSDKGLDGGSWRTYDRFEDHPINYVTWEQANHYCDVHLQRLPTEAEWEWAARGGPAGHTYPWGNEPPTAEPCWNGPGNDAPEGMRKQTCALGSHGADMTPQGVFDMAGNVYEWTATPAGKGERIIRGAAWNTRRASGLEASSRESAQVGERSFSLGFRCVLSPQPAKP